MKKILALSLTFALASAFVGISDGIKTNSQNALRDQIDELHILASTVETNDKELAINDEYTINKANDYRILPRNIDTYREETNQNQVRNNTNNNAVVNNQTNTKQTTSSTNNNLNTQNSTNGVQNINNTNGTNRVSNQTSSLNNVVNDGTTANLNGVNSINNINQNGTNNLSYNNQGTSPYGINNANSGILPNQGNGNKTVDGVIANNNTNNLDSMVRTNNIDTYKNNANTNIDGNVYNNNGGLVNNGANNITNNTNNGVASNVPNANNTINNNAQNTTTPNTTDTNRNVVVDDNVQNNTTDSVDNDKNNTNTTATTDTTKTDITNNTTNQTTDDTTKNTTDITQNFVLDMATIQQDIADLNDRISAQNEEMNQNMELARANMAKLLDNSVTLEQAKIKLINGYSHTLQCMTQKLAQNHFDLMHSAGMLALVQSTEGNNADLSPIYLEIKGTLLSREIYFDCANDALKAINGVFGDTNDVSTLELNKNNTKPTETTNNSQYTNKTTTPVKTTTKNDKVITQNGISQNKTTFEQKPVANNDRVAKDRVTNGVDINNAGIHARTLENKNMDRPVVNVRGPVKNQAKMATPNPELAEKQTINSPKARLDNSKQESQNVGFGKTNTNSIISSGQF